MLWISATIAMALPAAGHASDGRIGFIGAVTTPTCTLSVSGVGTSVSVNGISSGTFFSISADDCDAAADTTKMGATPLVSIYFESINSGEQESAGIISIVYK